MDNRYSLNGGMRDEKEFFYKHFKPYFESKGAEVRWNHPGGYQGTEPDFTVVWDGQEKDIELKVCNYITEDYQYFVIEYQQLSDETYKKYEKYNNAGWRYYCEADEIWFWLKKLHKVVCVNWKKLKNDLISDDMKRGITKPEYTPAILGGGGRERKNACSVCKKNDAKYEEHCILPYIKAWYPDEAGIEYLCGRKLSYNTLSDYIVDELDIYEDDMIESKNYEI